MKTFEVSVEIVPLRLSPFATRILRQANSYDRIVFTSKNAQEIFEREMHRLHIAMPTEKIIRVGPREDLLKHDLRNRRILFPRSKLAPFGIVRKLRSRGTVVQTITLYTARGKKLTRSEKQTLLSGTYDRLHFKSPSGIYGFLHQFSPQERITIKNIPAHCIGTTTTTAARKAGFRHIRDLSL
jgi:uroporphyrinogen-III synthase